VSTPTPSSPSCTVPALPTSTSSSSTALPGRSPTLPRAWSRAASTTLATTSRSRAKIFRVPRAARPASPFEAEPTRDDHLHDLVRAGVDRLHRRVRVVLRDRHLEHEAVASVELEALAREPLLEVGRPPLRHADLSDGVVTANVRRHQLVDERLPDLDLGRELDEPELGVLEGRDRPTEGAALARVGYRVVERAAGR